MPDETGNQSIVGDSNAQVQGSGSSSASKADAKVELHVHRGASLSLGDVTPFQREDAQAGAVGTLPALANVPYQRPVFFTGRQNILHRLHTLFESGKSVIGLNGLGGIGKTLTAIEYAYQYSAEYQAVFWVTADERLTSDLVALATKLELPEKDATEQSVAVNAVKRWLEHNTKWLLILDNVEDLAVVRQFVSLTSRGHILFTTLAQVLGSIAYSVEIEKMTVDEGAHFLLHRVGILRPDQDHAALHTHLAQAKAIVKAVDGLPLALEQAGAYINENSCDLTEYLALYEKQHKTLLDYRSELETEQKTVMTTWSLSFESVEKADTVASALLEFCAFLHPDSISKDVVIACASQLGSVLASNVMDTDKLNGAIRLLRRYSLLRSTPDLTILTIHRLVQTVLKDRMDQEIQREWAERTVKAVNQAFPDVEFNVWARCEQLLPHAQVCVMHINQWTMAFLEAARLLYVTGKYLYERGRYPEAEPLLQHGLRLRKQLLGDEHIAVAECLNSLAELYRTQGKYLAAMPLCEQALYIREQSLKEEHPDVATSINNLGRLYHHLGRFADAEMLYQRALNIRRRTLDAENSDLAWTLNDLGVLYRDQGKYAEAGSLYLEAREITERTLGKDHPDMAARLTGLASLYGEQGRYAEAGPLHLEAREITERTLGKNHPAMANRLNNLAAHYQRLGRYVEAKQSYQRALAIQERVFGTKHPDLVYILGSLASLYANQRNYSDAEPLYQRALKICEQTKPLYHPKTLNILQGYANMLRMAKRNTKAVEIEGRLEEMQTEILGQQP